MPAGQHGTLLRYRGTFMRLPRKLPDNEGYVQEFADNILVANGNGGMLFMFRRAADYALVIYYDDGYQA